MRKSSPLDCLISKTVQGLLAVTVLQPDRSWYLSDLANRLNVRPSTLQTSLAALVKAGILSRRKDGNRVYYQADPICPFLSELQGLIRKTAGQVDVLREPFPDRKT
ncbi:MAG TPA: winged helix-turn-helix domain-containing protein [Thermoguttaceae bacterium]|nr:winged helix-turn-helix domain-containing protein [Thermoguttaceae bacterium]